MSKINVKFLTDEALATIKANLDKFTKIVKKILQIVAHLSQSSQKSVL